jgi:DNA-binding NarL/FixJ family response regulator
MRPSLGLGNVGHMVRCVIVDDSPHFLAAAQGLLAREGITVVGVASTSSDALAVVRQLRPDVLLLDIDLGGESGLSLAGRLSTDQPGTPRVILVSAHAEQDYADLIANSPAIGFLSKTAVSGDAIRRLLQEASGEA